MEAVREDNEKCPPPLPSATRRDRSCRELMTRDSLPFQVPFPAPPQCQKGPTIPSPLIHHARKSPSKRSNRADPWRGCGGQTYAGLGALVAPLVEVREEAEEENTVAADPPDEGLGVVAVDEEQLERVDNDEDELDLKRAKS